MFLPVFGLELQAGQRLQHRQNHKDVSGVPQRGTALFSLFVVLLLFFCSLLLFWSLRSGFSSWIWFCGTCGASRAEEDLSSQKAVGVTC